MMRDTILVVDDSAGTLGLLTDAIEAAGHTVLVATEGEAALTLVEKIVPDLILMDAVMPGLDGFETCRRLKRREALTHVPLIFMTGLTETEHIVRGFEAGGVDYVTKPIVPEELIARIRVHLANARLAGGARAALDATGRYLFAVGRDGTLRWATAQSLKLAGAVLDDPARFPADTIKLWLDRVTAVAERTGDRLALAGGPPGLMIGFIGHTLRDELLLQLLPPDEDKLKAQFNLTPRETEVLMWLARGKANRDIAAILQLSPRTITTHLETIYSKLGVENRTAAAGLALKVLQ